MKKKSTTQLRIAMISLLTTAQLTSDDAAASNSISDAEIAVNASRDAQVIINGNIFSNNHNHIFIKDYYKKSDPDDDLSIKGNAFWCTSLKTYGSNKTFACITLKNVLNGTIGEASNGNTFENANYEVYVDGSGARIFDNTFKNLEPYTSGTYPGAAILAINPEYYNDSKIIIGNGTNAKNNTFDNNPQSVIIDGEYNVAINKNDFVTVTGSNQRQGDVFINHNETKDVEISLNTISNYVQGIIIENAGHANTTDPWIKIHDNTISNAFSTTGIDGIGISIANFSSQTSRIAISDNTITDPRIGIYMQYVDGAKIYKDATGNSVAFNLTTAPTNLFAGVQLNHCNGVYVHENSITNTTAFASGNLHGLSFSASTDGNYCSNTIDKMSYSIYFDDDCQNTVLKLNKMTGYHAAIYFNNLNTNTKFSPQGTASETWDNEFEIGNTYYRLDGVQYQTSNIDWYHKSGNLDISPYNVAKVNTNNCPTCSTTTCEALPLRISNTVLNYDTSLRAYFEIFPNPSSTQLFIMINDSTDSRLELCVIDNLGRIVLYRMIEQSLTEIDVSHFYNGIYSLRLNGQNGYVKCRSFIVNH